MRIVMIGPFGLQPLGTMRVRALPLARALVRRGHEVHVLLPPWQNPEDAGRTWNDAGVTVENMPLPAGIPGWFHWQLTRKLVKRTRQLKPDVVHCFKPKAYAGLAHWALRGNYPIVVDTDDWEGAGGWNDMQAYPPLLKRVFAWQEHFGLAKADAVTAASRALQTLAWSHGGKTERVVYLPNGVILPNNDSLDNIQPRRPTVLLYTRFYTYSMERLWQVLSRLRGEMPEIRLLVVGQGFNKEEDDLCARASQADWQVARTQDLNVDADLLYTGYGSPDFVQQCFAQSTVGLYLFDDTLLNRTKCPVKLLDMLAAGVPVIGDAVGEIREMIAHGKSGMLVPAGDVDAMVKTTLDVLDDLSRCSEMRQAAMQDLCTRFSWDHMAEIAERAFTYVI